MLIGSIFWSATPQLAHETGPGPIPLDYNYKPAAAKRANPVAAADRSDEALKKAARNHTAEHTAVHSFTSLFDDLATIRAKPDRTRRRPAWHSR